MHNIQYVRENPELFDASLFKRGLNGHSKDILSLDEKRRAMIHLAETAKAEQNLASKEVGLAKARGDDAEFERLRLLVSEKKSEISTAENDAKLADEALRDLLMRIPNLPFDDVPVGKDESENIEVLKWSTPSKLDFTPKEHFEISSVKHLFDFDRAAKISGSRFVILRGAIARLHRALGQFMVDLHINDHGLDEVLTPVLVRETALYGTGNLPKFADDLYKTESDHWLIPTAEVTLTNLVSDEIVDGDKLPFRFVAQTQCFRSEAGSAGRDTSGMLRQHQFEKIEMVTICTPENSEAEHQRMTECAENVLKNLNLPYRKIVLCTGDMGFGSRKTYDLEVWLPGQNCYREISSCSNCGDFQARRMNGRYRNLDQKPEFLHTLNGSGLAVGRCLIAVVENGQQADGSIIVPDVLHRYLGGANLIDINGNLVKI